MCNIEVYFLDVKVKLLKGWWGGPGFQEGDSNPKNVENILTDFSFISP